MIPINSETAAGDTSVSALGVTANFNLLAVYAQLSGLSVDPKQLVRELGVDSNMSAGQWVQALQTLGFETRFHAVDESGNDAKVLKQLAKVNLPALALDGSDNLLIVGKLDGQISEDISITLQRSGALTPAVMNAKAFFALGCTGIITAKRAAIRTAQSSTDIGHELQKFGFGWFWNSLKNYKGLMSEILLASFFVQIFALVTPLIFQVVIDKVLTHRSLTTLDVMVIALLGVSIFEVVLSAMRHYLFSHTTNRIDVELGSKLFRHLMHLPLNYFETRRSGDTVARVRELENARNFMTGQALTSWLDLLFAIVFLAVMFYYSPSLTCIVIAALPIFFGASWVITPLLRKRLEDKFAQGAENQTFLVETVTSMETLKSHAVEPQWQREWDRRLSDYVNSSFHSGHLANATNQFTSLASKLVTVLLLYFGATQVIGGNLTVGGLIAFNMLSGRASAPILKLASLWQEFTQMKVSIKRLGDIMDAPAEPAFRPGRITPPDLQGRVTFDHVSFRYGPHLPEVVSDLNFEANPGDIIGITGISGAGKTTLMRLMQRLYTPEKGRMLVDGMDLGLVDTSWLRRQMGVVGQDTQLFNRSVRDNIAFGNPSVSSEAVMGSARLAGAHDFILDLPDGYDTLIGERGGRLSGGQRARIAIARALVTNPRILLLDEATAALDYESERVIHSHMDDICAGRTVFIVAHRLSTLRLATHILVLEKGRLIEQGKHPGLIAHNGRYASLYQSHQILEAV